MMAQPTDHPPHSTITYLMYDFDKMPRTPEVFHLPDNNNFFVSLSVPITICPAHGQDTVSVFISVGFLSIPDGVGMKGEGLFTIETVGYLHSTVTVCSVVLFLHFRIHLCLPSTASSQCSHFYVVMRLPTPSLSLF
jgi:hypothetical protein